jgi:hypothetical protein
MKALTDCEISYSSYLFGKIGLLILVEINLSSKINLLQEHHSRKVLS